MSTFGDSTASERRRLRKYVLAQLRSDGDLEWVAALGARLVLVSEVSSRALDELQAADVATAWAREVRSVCAFLVAARAHALLVGGQELYATFKRP